MKGTGRKISLMAIAAAVFLLVAARIVPHHHCCAGFGPAVGVSQMHIGFEECGSCHGCDAAEGHSHEESGHQCFVDVELYFRATADDGCLAKKIYTPLTYFVIPQLTLAGAPAVEECEWYDLHIFKLKERTLLCRALRAPPSPLFCV